MTAGPSPEERPVDRAVGRAVDRAVDDPESPDAATPEGFDLTPRTAPDRSAGRGGRSRAPLALAGVGLVVVALGLVIFNGLRDASTFFYNVDEAVERREELGTDRIRMQGNVVPGSVRTTDEGVEFVIAYAGAEVPVRHVGDPPELFGPKIPVVLEGSFGATTGPARFSSDEILVRHDSTYDEKNADRVREAQQDADERADG